MKNLLLLSCRSPYVDSDKIYPALGNLYLQTALQKAHPEINVTVSDEYRFDDVKWLEGFDTVGVSIMTPQRAEASKILDFIKTWKPGMTTIAGGPHVRYYFSEIMNEPWDYLVTKDGERAIVQIADGFENIDVRVISDEINLKDYPTVAVKPERKKNKKYLEGFSYTLNGKRSTTMMCARGCPEHCTFCEDARTQVKWTPLEMIKEELDDIVELGYKGVYIFDDIFAIAPKKVKPICDELKRRDLIYRCNGQARMFSRDFAQQLADTGCYEIAFGAETGSQKILDNILKRTTVQQNYDFVKWCNEFGIVCKAFLMVGLPGEDLDTIAETERFIATSGIKDFQLAIYYPYVGTAIRDGIDKGDGSQDLFFLGEGLGAYGQKGGKTECVVRTSALSAEQLLEIRDGLVERYRPKAHQEKWKDQAFFDTHLAGGNK